MTFRTSLPVFAAAACRPAAAPAAAQDNSLYTVSGVHVDATGASSTEALNAAIAQGRGKAFQILYRRLTRQEDWARQPALDAAGLLRISRGYNIANERRSTTRYVADVTYMFNPEGGGAHLARRPDRLLADAGQAHPGDPHVARRQPRSLGPGPDGARVPRQRGALHPAGRRRRRGAGGAEFRTAGWNDVVGRGGEEPCHRSRRWCRRSMPMAR